MEQEFLFTLGKKDEPYIQPKLLSGFLTMEECKRLVEESDKLGFKESTVGDYAVDKRSRSSKTCWVYPENTPFLQEIYKKKVKQLPEIQEMGDKAIFEACQVVQYQKDQEYKAHYDQCFENEDFCKDQIKRFGGPRKLTLLMYIQDTCEGGETVFPNLNIKFKPKTGDALLFHSLTMDNRKVHPMSFHQGSPVISGEKRIANVWIRLKQN